ncbi:Glutamate racemase [bacterium HR21]|nr:Glutamate racemase [bacterium HR21]
MARYRRIGVFDSGIGGLTVVQHVLSCTTGVDVVYLGDTARVPYGSRSPETIRRYARELTRFLLAYGVEMLVVACNTVSAVALEAVREEAAGVPLLDVLEPTIDLVLECTAGCVGIIGTRATIASGAYERLLRQRAPASLRIFSQPCPLFVPLVEEGWSEHPVAEQIAQEYLSPLREAGVDTLVLGCTHYPLLVPVLRRVMPECRFVESGEAIARCLRQLGDSGAGGTPPRLTVLLTDAPGPALEQVMKRLGLLPREVRQVSVSNHD